MVVAALRSTMPQRASQPARVGRLLAWLALAIGLSCAVAALLAGPAYRAAVLPLNFALQTVRWAGTLAIGGGAIALLAVLLVLGRSARPRWRRRAMLALALNAGVAAWPLYLYFQLQNLPHIHDITTDTANPPTFDAVIPLRQGARNPTDYAPATAAEQRRGYPDIAPLRVPLMPVAAFDYAERTARSMGWQIVAATPEKLRIEATATTLLFGFKDDIVVRITPEPGGCVIDVRSLSRIGGSDFGSNARRVRTYLQRIAERAIVQP